MGSVCTECYAPYQLSEDGKSCIECLHGYDEKTRKCLSFDSNDGKVKNTDRSTSIECKSGYTLNTNTCKKIDGDCWRQGNASCEWCKSENTMTTSNDCTNNVTHCKYSSDAVCLLCEGRYTLDANGKCQESNMNECLYQYDNRCLIASEGEYISTVKENGGLMSCESSSAVCFEHNEIRYDYRCDGTSYLHNESNVCVSVGDDGEYGCTQVHESQCVSCQEKHHVENGQCVVNDDKCTIQEREKCMKCVDGYILVGGECIDVSTIGCEEINSKTGKCKTCGEGTYKEDDGCETQEGSEYSRCLHINRDKNGCYECKCEYRLTNRYKCLMTNETSDDDTQNSSDSNSEENENQDEKDYSDGDESENDDDQEAPHSTLKRTLKREDDEHKTDSCEMHSEKGCLKCADGYYLDGRECKKCHYLCERCSDYETCIGCNEYSFLNGSKCVEINQVYVGCEVMMASNKGCFICKDGYFKKNGIECGECHSSCETCLFSESCLKCKEEHWRKYTEDGHCHPYDELTHCTNKTQHGCEECEEGTYLSDYECFECPENCTTCTSSSVCTTCESEYVLVKSECIHFEDIEHCLSANNSVCLECAEGYELNDDSSGCRAETSNTGLIVGLSVGFGGLFLMIIVITVIVVVILVIIQRRKEEEKMRNVCVFSMKRSNITFFALKEGVYTNKGELRFDEDIAELPVEEETRELICIGNRSGERLKIQFTTKEGCDKYQIRTEPQIVSMKDEEACEFEVFVKPMCTCTMDDQILLVVLNIKEGVEKQVPIPIRFKTAPSTRIDYDELKEEKKLGEGSFGIVYLGDYRGNKVAIKRMKQLDDANVEKGMDEFTKEVKMLDKFRCEYIVHFYGAVFIPNKLCIVTEFAQY
ncbi:MAG: protein kinase, partial [Clostridia bacterium]|nr:protein kinase [Clostridia bacterium]